MFHGGSVSDANEVDEMRALKLHDLEQDIKHEHSSMLSIEHELDYRA